MNSHSNFFPMLPIMAIILLFLMVTLSEAQVTQSWASIYAGPAGSEDFAKSIAVDGQGNVYVTGWSFGGSTWYDWATIKYSPDGAQLWVVRYNGPGNDWDFANALAVDPAGNVYVTGSSTRSQGDQDILTIKYSTAGVLLWQARYDGPASGNDMSNALCLDAEGNVYVTGASQGGASSFDYVTIKFNNQGLQQWAARYDGPGHGIDAAYDIAVNDDDCVFITGASWGGDELGLDYATVKYDASGNQIWAARYHHGPLKTDDQARALDLDNQGNVYVTGWSGQTIFNRDYATIKYDTAGNQQWVARYNGPGDFHDWGFDVAVDTLTGSVFVTGYSDGGSTGDDYATIKYNASGTEQWVARYDQGGGNEVCRSLALDEQGNVYVTGGGQDYATLKYSPSGQVLWTILYNGPQNGNDEANDIVRDAVGNVYVTGQSGGFEVNDYATVKYTQASAPNLVLSLIPYTWPIQIPSSGGSFEYLLQATNLGSAQQATDLWTQVILPNGCLKGPLQVPITVVLDTGVTVWQRRQMVPAAAPPGSYTYVACAGDYPYEVWASDSLAFTKQGSGDAAMVNGTIQNWEWLDISAPADSPVKKFSPLRNHPNPFNASTVISFKLQAASHVRLQVYDTAGRLVTTLADGWRKAGEYQTTFGEPSQAAGVYFIRLEREGEVTVGKIVVVK